MCVLFFSSIYVDCYPFSNLLAKSYPSGSSDFFGLNYYTTRYAVAGTCEDDPSYKGDCNFEEQTDPEWTRLVTSCRLLP